MTEEFRNHLSKDEADIILKNVPLKVKSYSSLRAKNAVLCRMTLFFSLHGAFRGVESAYRILCACADARESGHAAHFSG